MLTIWKDRLHLSAGSQIGRLKVLCRMQPPINFCYSQVLTLDCMTRKGHIYGQYPNPAHSQIFRRLKKYKNTFYLVKITAIYFT